MSGQEQKLISHTFDHEKRVLLVRPGPRAHFRHMVDDFRQLAEQRPEIATYDYILDLTEFRGDAFVADVKAIADEHARFPANKESYTCFATRDPHFGLWAKSMDHMFVGRKHVVFPSVEACSTFLEQERRTN